MNKPTHLIADLEELIYTAKFNEVTLFTTSTIAKDGKVVFPLFNIFDKYKDIIDNLCVSVTLTDDELYIYRYNPHALSLKLYGTVELWYLLLKLNKKVSAVDFTDASIKILHPKNISILNSIILKEREHIESNRQTNGI